MFEKKSLQLRDQKKSEGVQTDSSKPGYFSSALVVLSRSLHTRFCTYLEMKNLTKERDRNELKASLLASEAKVARARNELENVSYETEAETIKAKGAAQLGNLEFQKKVCQAEKGLAQSQNDLDLVTDPGSHLLKKKETSLQFEESIARLQANIRTLTQQAKGSAGEPQPRPKPSPQETRERKMEWLNVQQEDAAILDQWRKDRLSELDEFKRKELADLNASSLEEGERAKKRHEIDARYANRREQILAANI